jgi:hypothetical protein
MARALRPGGYLYLGMKLGDGEARDAIGRFYSYVTRAELETMVLDAGLAVVDVEEGEGKGLAGTVDPFILMTCQKTGQAMPELFAYTDGACSGNPGPGGWGALLQAKDGETVVKERELKGGDADTTNNRMELLAAISALEALERPSTHHRRHRQRLCEGRDHRVAAQLEAQRLEDDGQESP